MATKEATAATKKTENKTKKWNRKWLCLQTGVDAAGETVFTGVNGIFQIKRKSRKRI